MEDDALYGGLVGMKPRLFLGVLLVALLVFAVAGWTVQGVRWTLAGAR